MLDEFWPDALERLKRATNETSDAPMKPSQPSKSHAARIDDVGDTGHGQRAHRGAARRRVPLLHGPGLAVKWIADAAYLDARQAAPSPSTCGATRPAAQYLEVDPPRRVVFTWGIEDSVDLPPGSSTVEVVLEADGDETVVTLTHRDLPTAEFRRSHQAGWSEFLGLLAERFLAAPSVA